MGTGTLTTQLSGIVAYLDQSVRTAGQFAASQFPLVIQELIRWKIVQHSMQCFFFVVLAIAGGIVFKFSVMNARKAMKKHDDYSEAPFLWGLAAVISTFILFGSLFIASAHLLFALEAFIAPRVFLLEYTAEMLKAQ